MLLILNISCYELSSSSLYQVLAVPWRREARTQARLEAPEMDYVPAAAVAPPSSEFELGGFEINEEELLAPVGVLINSLVPSPGYLVAHFA